MSWVIRAFVPDDLDGCSAVMLSNTPTFFDPSEHSEFIHDLTSRQRRPEQEQWPYFVLVTNQQVRACGGYALTGKDSAMLVWGMVNAQEHRQGLGTALLNYRLSHMPEHVRFVDIDTTPASMGFYEAIGFQQNGFEKNGYGPGLDKILARYTLVPG